MIVIINNHGQFTHLIHRSLRDIGIDNKLVSNTISPSELNELNPNGVILSGGPDIEKTGNSRDILLSIDVPVLGICLGHQIIAKTFGGVVKPGSSGGYAEVDVEILNNNGLFRDLGDKTVIWASHSDEVSEAPSGFKITARSKLCDVEAMAHKEKPIFGIQGHPEVAHTPEGEKILRNFLQLCE
ncbi:GMP synthase subunit A [Methanonatronarchaeum sp. AMET-Sl]|uniref:GMP synthase subunit A n=1 Tax=Methanonatronarchaeum sp. AMET-Sl TaxID=3037654 RepID=UPI00244DE488|nr:GMP synthase subunit A [Methanonatronarchaeum sp. AMET-Sl]WGI17294.1 GMP synthase subunit A [Methanonatronarchaeum sp. AMET-Sl]